MTAERPAGWELVLHIGLMSLTAIAAGLYPPVYWEEPLWLIGLSWACFTVGAYGAALVGGELAGRGPWRRLVCAGLAGCLIFYHVIGWIANPHTITWEFQLWLLSLSVTFLVALFWRRHAALGSPLHLPPPPVRRAPARLAVGPYQSLVLSAPPPDVAAPAPAVGAKDSPAGPLPEGFVEAGFLRVDLAKAVDKLARYQLAEPEGFLLCWLRCAQACGASAISIAPEWDGFVMKFDGAPLPAGLLKDPVGALLGGLDDAREQGRHLSVGLLAAMRLEAARIVVASGEGAERRQVQWFPEGTQDAPRPEPGTGTVLRVDWPPGPGAQRRTQACMALARRGFGLASARLKVAGRAVPAWPVRGGWVRFAVDDARGVIGWVDEGAARSRVRLYARGAFVQEILWDFPGRTVVVEVEDPGFALNLSHAGVIADSRFDETMSKVAAVVAETPPSWLFERRLGSFRRERLLETARGRPRRDAIFAALSAMVLGLLAWLRWDYDAAATGQVLPVVFFYGNTIALPWLWAFGFCALAAHLRATGRCRPLIGRLSPGALGLASAIFLLGLGTQYVQFYVSLVMGQPGRIMLRR